MAHVDFFYDFVCPYAYLAHRRIEALCAEEGASLTHRPMLLGGVFRAIGAPDVPMTTMSPQRRNVQARDLERWAARWAMPLRFPASHPRRTVLALRAALAAGADVATASRALFDAYWVRGEDVEDAGVVERALDGAGLEGAKLVLAAGTEAVKAALRASTDEAIAAGVFGAPSFVVHTDRGAQLFWGQDRLAFVKKAIGGWWVELPTELGGTASPVGAGGAA